MTQVANGIYCGIYWYMLFSTIHLIE